MSNKLHIQWQGFVSVHSVSTSRPKVSNDRRDCVPEEDTHESCITCLTQHTWHTEPSQKPARDICTQNMDIITSQQRIVLGVLSWLQVRNRHFRTTWPKHHFKTRTRDCTNSEGTVGVGGGGFADAPPPTAAAAAANTARSPPQWEGLKKQML